MEKREKDNITGEESGEKGKNRGTDRRKGKSRKKM